MEAANGSELFRACRDGDVATVRRILPHTSLATLNRLESNGSTPLHIATRNNHIEIVRLLLKHGAPRRVLDAKNRTPRDLTQTREVADLYSRPREAAKERFAANPVRQPEWLFGEDTAEDYSRAIEWNCVKDRGVKKTVKKIEDKNVLPDDDSDGSKLLRFYFDEARESNDPTFLLKAYTVESPFYNGLNSYMATGSPREVYQKLCDKWSGYYAGVIMKHPALNKYRYKGVTYRGMKVPPADLEQYKPGVALTNKAFQSTSKSSRVALAFACGDPPPPGKLPLLLIYNILDSRSGLDIAFLSEYEDEDEVLLMPGTLFRVDYVENSRTPVQVVASQIV